MVIFTYVLALAVAYLFQSELLFVPIPGDFAACPALTSIGFTAEDHRVGAERVRAYVRRNRSARAWLLIYHGNAESACRGIEYVRNLADFPLNLAVIEYPGYRGDSGALSENSYLSNAEAAYLDLTGAPKPLPVLFLGRSLGTGVATYVASRHPAAGLIEISPYTSIADVAAHAFPLLPTKLICRDVFPAAEWAKSVDAPTLVVHGALDRLIPARMGKLQSENFPRLVDFVEVPGADHNRLVDDTDGLGWRRIREFIADRLGEIR